MTLYTFLIVIKLHVISEELNSGEYFRTQVTGQLQGVLLCCPRHLPHEVGWDEPRASAAGPPPPGLADLLQDGHRLAGLHGQLIVLPGLKVIQRPRPGGGGRT